MDPLSIVGTSLGLARTAVQIAQSLHDLKSKYARAATTLSAISSECTFLSTGLSQLGQMIQRDPNSFARRLSANDGQQDVPLDTALQTALESCAFTLSALDSLTDRYLKKATSSSVLSWKSKAKYLWNEDEMKDLLHTVRGLYQAISFLLTVLQTDSVSEIKQMMVTNMVVLKNMVKRSHTIKSTYAASTISGTDTTFAFDDQIVSSSAYRRAFRSFVKKTDTPPPQHESNFLKPDKLIEPDRKSEHSWQFVGDGATETVANSMASPTIYTPGHSPSPSQNVVMQAPPSPVPASMHTILPYVPNSPAQSGLQIPSPSIVRPITPIQRKPLLIPSNQTPHQLNLMFRSASEKGNNIELLNTLFDQGADIESADEKGLRPLHLAVQKGHKEVVKLLLAFGANVEVTDTELQETPLHKCTQHNRSEIAELLVRGGQANLEAASKNLNRPLNLCGISGDVKTAQVLLELGADIDGAGCLGWSPIHHAVGNNKPLVAAFLLDHGANVNFVATNGDTPLHTAAQYGFKPCVEMLIKGGADIEARSDDMGNSPLGKAANHGQRGAAETLIRLGADIEGPNKHGNHPMNLAAVEGKTAIVETLFKLGANIEGIGCLGWKPLHHAAGNSRIAALKSLLKLGAEKDSEADNGSTPLHVAAQHGCSNTLEELIKIGADISARDNNGWLPIHYAASNGLLRSLQALLKAGSDKDAVADDSTHPIHLAAKEGKTTIIQELLDAGAEFDCEGPKGQQPVYMAAGNPDTSALALLIKAGANVNATGVNSERPIHLAAQKDCADNIRLLLKAGADREVGNHDTNKAINLAAVDGSMNSLKALLDCGADPNTRGFEGWTPMMHAAGNGKTEVVEHLLQLGAGQLCSNNGDTPLHNAARYGFADLARKLLDARAVPNMAQDSGSTPLHYAVEKGHLEVVRVLLERGANKELQDDKQRTPLQLAIIEGHTTIVEMLS